MAIRRFDLEHGDAEQGVPAKMISHPSGDYVEWGEHNEIVETLQYQLDGALKAISNATNALNSL